MWLSDDRSVTCKAEHVRLEERVFQLAWIERAIMERGDDVVFRVLCMLVQCFTRQLCQDL